MKIKGLVAATFTPMSADGSIVYEKIPELVAYSVKSRIAALFVNGSTGEFSALCDDERLKLAEAYLKAAEGKIPVIVHVGSASVTESALLARHAKDNGAAGVGALAPFYFRPSGVRALADALKVIAAACAPLPFYYYHIPVLTGVNVRVRELLPIAMKEIPNFAGVKFTHEDLMDFQLSMDRFAGRCQMMFGRDELLLAGLALGAEAAVGSTFNFIPQVYHKVMEAFARGDMPEARRWQSKSQEVIDYLPSFGFAAQKTMMKFAGVDVGPARLPVTNLTPAQEDDLRRRLDKASLLELIK